MDAQPALPPRAARTLAAHSLRLTTAIDALLVRGKTPTTATAALATLAAQATAIAASLQQLHALLLRDGCGCGGGGGGGGDDGERDHPAAALDAALRACAFAFACLDAEVRRLSEEEAAAAAETPSGGAPAAAAAAAPEARKWRIKRMSASKPTQTQRTAAQLPKWRDDAMTELLRQLRGVRAVLAGWVRALLVVPGLDEEEESPGWWMGEVVDGEVGEQLVRGEKALRAAWPGVEGMDLVAGGEGEVGFVEAVMESEAYRAAVAKAAAMRDVVGRGDGGAADVEGPGENGELGPSGAQAVAEVDGVVKETGQGNGGPAGLQEGAVTAEAASNKPQKAASNADVTLEDNEDAPPLPPREQNTKESEEDEDAPPLPPRRPTASPPAVASSSTADDTADDNPEPSPHGPDHTEDTTASTPRPSADAAAPPPTPPAVESDGPATLETANPSPSPETTTTSPLPPAAADPTPPPAPPPSPPLHLSPRELLIHQHWQTLLLSELRHITTLHSLVATLTHSPTLHASWPQLLPHLDALLAPLSLLASLHTRHLLQPLAVQLRSVVKSDLLLPVFRLWWRKAGATVMAVARRVPHAVAAVRVTEKDGEGFRRWVGEVVGGVEGGLEGVLGSPVGRLEGYCEVLGAVEGLERGETGEEGGGDGGERSTQVGDYRRMMGRIKEACETVMREAADAEVLREMHRRIQTLDSRNVDVLDLFGRERRLVWQGSLACRTKGKGLWNQVHCVLLDNYFFWGRVERPREMWFGKYKYGEKLWVLEAPMPVQQLECSFDAALDGKTKASIIDNVPRGSELFVFSVKAGEVKHSMAAATSDDRQTWVNFLQSSAA